jgi:hypothetical protein
MLGDLARIEPDAHRVVARAEDQDLPHAIDARQAILHVEERVVAQVRHVVALVRRDEVHDHREVRRALHRREAQAPHFLGQPRLGLRDAVLHLLLRLVGIGAELERDREREAPVGRRLAAHVEHVLDAVDRLLERHRHRLGDHLRVRAGVIGTHDDRRRHHLRILRDRQQPHRNGARDEDEERQDAGEDGRSMKNLERFMWFSPGHSRALVIPA